MLARRDYAMQLNRFGSAEAPEDLMPRMTPTQARRELASSSPVISRLEHAGVPWPELTRIPASRAGVMYVPEEAVELLVGDSCSVNFAASGLRSVVGLKGTSHTHKTRTTHHHQGMDVFSSLQPLYFLPPLTTTTATTTTTASTTNNNNHHSCS
jgi:hypothetical protein